jgi:hypothetical protein
MRRSRLPIPIIFLALGSCSYNYDVNAVVSGGKLAFVVDPNSRNGPSCINQIDVVASGDARAKPAFGDDAARIRYGTFWHQSLEYDCVDAFPIFYGQQLRGKPQPSGRVSAKPLRIGTVYDVAITSGTGGYGSGSFKIMADHTVLNVPRQPLAR